MITLVNPYRFDDTLWTPAQIATALWLDAADVATITESGGAVSQWDDKSGGGADAANASAPNQPLTSTYLIDGKNVIRFDGNDTLETVFNPFGATIVDYFVYMVARRQTFSGWRYLWCMGHNVDRLGISQSAGVREHYNRGIQLVTNDLPAVGVAFMDGYYGSTTDGTMENWLNGSLSGSKANANSADSVNRGIIVGGLSQNSPSSAQADIAECVVVAGVRVTAIQQKIEGYLAWKWGLEGDLPVGHPYKAAPPYDA